MKDFDVSLFDRVISQTSRWDRLSLLAVQRAVTKNHASFAYLEIGSYMGGSIQPYLLSPHCQRIYSIDRRTATVADDRPIGSVDYDENTTAKMLENLRRVDASAVYKITCFDSDASDVDRSLINLRPMVSFIDGEHTQEAVISDFNFCRSVTHPAGVILFHDYPIIYLGIRDCLRQLKAEKRQYTAFLIGGVVFGVFFDKSLIYSDPYLSDQYKQNHSWHQYHLMRQAVARHVKRLIPYASATATK